MKIVLVFLIGLLLGVYWGMNKQHDEDVNNVVQHKLGHIVNGTLVLNTCSTIDNGFWNYPIQKRNKHE